MSRTPAAWSGEPPDQVDALVQLSFAVQRELAAAGAEHDLSVVQMRLLGVLRDRTPSMLELGAHLGLDKSSTTGLVTRAERRGLVRRTPSPYDGRAVLVSATEEGHRLASECGRKVAGRLRKLTAHLDEPSRAELTRLADEVSRQAVSAERADRPGP